MNAPRRLPRRKVDGVLVLDKPLGMTSNTALQIARRLLNAEKAGHTGTLDPLATGLLPLCFGEATKFSSELLNADKSYEATLRLGVTTTTADAEGEVLQTRPVAVSTGMLEEALSRFIGEIRQVPPMHSALKRDGKPLYEYARAGIEVQGAPRAVTIYANQLLGWRDDEVRFVVTCSKGTYIRTLAEDIGEVLGCGAHLTALRRIRIGDIALDSAATLTALEEAQDKDSLLLPTDFLLKNLPELHLDEESSERILHGQSIKSQEGKARQRFRIYAANACFIGLGALDDAGNLLPKRLIAA